MNTTSLQAVGLLLFAFIPVVLYLYVAHPEPIGGSLVLGVVLMLGHRFLARPYMRRAAPRKCLWSNGGLPLGEDSTASVKLHHGGGVQEARCRAVHRDSLLRFFTFARRWRWPLRLGIFVPLLALLAALAGAALGAAWATEARIATVTDIFRLVIGLTVQVAAWGWLSVRPDDVDDEPVVPFPVHNFFLLGVRNLLWVLRLVGIWWIWLGFSGLLQM